MTQFEQQYQQQHQQQHFVNSNYPLEVSVFNQNPDKFYCDFDEDDDPNELYAVLCKKFFEYLIEDE